MSVLDISADAYHADPCERPSLSASIAKILCSSSPAHAKVAHPKFNPDVARKEAAHFDIGTAAHAMLLEGRDAVAVIDADDWRTKAAKQERDEAREQGKVPLLVCQWDDVQAMVVAACEQLAAVDLEPKPFVAGKPEQTIVWEEPNGVLCRSLIDWLHDDHSTVDDYKTTSRSASPEQWSRSIFSFGGDIQAAFYLRGLNAVFGDAARDFRFVVQETFPPYALAVFSLAPDAFALAEAKVEYAIRKWGECLSSGSWPAYPTRVCHVEMPVWEEIRFHEREMREAA